MRPAVPSRGRLLGVASLSLALIVPALPAAAASSHQAGHLSQAGSRNHHADGRSKKVTIRRDQRGHAHYIGPAAGRVLARGTDRSMSPEAAARRHMDRYAADFGISSPARDLRTESVEDLAAGQSVVRFQQTAAGLPVLGGQLVSVLDSANNLLSVTGETSTALRSSTYAVTARAAGAAALRVTAADHGLAAHDLRAAAPQQWLYDASLFDSTSAAGAHAVWRLEVTARDRLDVRELVLVDGATGRVSLHVDQIESAFNPHRAVCDNRKQRNNNYRCAKGHYVRTEGSASSGIADVDAAYKNAGAASTFYESLGLNLTALIGSDYGDGKRLRSTVRVCPSKGGGPCPYNNAFWDGSQMVYGQKYSRADDVVGHELTHGVTQHENGLAYWFQSGAINESMSDVFGEFIDKSEGTDNDSAWDLAEDLPGSPVRSMKTPTAFQQPDRVHGTYWTTGQIGGSTVDSGGVHTNSGVGNKAAYLITDGTGAGSFNGQTFPGLGLAKAKQIYWLTEKTLTPGADYADLANTLFAACSALADAAVAGIVDADCTGVVQKATTATQMTPAFTGPTEPRNVSIIGGYQQIRVRWSAPLSSGTRPVTSYIVTVTPAVAGDSFLAIDDPGARDVTIGGLPAGRTLTFSLLAVTSDGNSSPPSPPITLRGTKLSLSTESSVPYKKRAHLTAQLSLSSGGGLADRSVSLYRKVVGKSGYRRLNTKKTNSTGAVTFTPNQKHPSTYLATFAANSTIVLGSHSTKHQVALRHRVSLHVNHSSVHEGKSVQFSGRIRPADRSTVVVQRRPASGGSWARFAVAAVSSSGHYRLAWTPTSGRDFEWRVKVKKSSDFARGLSKTRLVRVT